MCSLSKEQFIVSRETIQNAFFFSELCSFFDLGKTFTFCNISVITKDIYMKLSVCIHYPKRNSCYQGRQFKMHFLFFLNLCPFPTYTFYPLSSTLQPSVGTPTQCSCLQALWKLEKIVVSSRNPATAMGSVLYMEIVHYLSNFELFTK